MSATTASADAASLELHLLRVLDDAAAWLGGLDMDGAAASSQHMIRISAQATLNELRQRVSSELMGHSNCYLMLAPASAHASAAAAHPTSRGLFDDDDREGLVLLKSAVARLPDAMLLSTVWPSSAQPLLLRIPRFTPSASVTIIVTVVQPTNTYPRCSNLILCVALEEAQLEVSNLQRATVADLCERVRRWMHLPTDDAHPVTLLTRQGTAIHRNRFVRTLVPGRRIGRVWFESATGLTSQQRKESNFQKDVISQGDDLNLSLFNNAAAPTSPVEIALPVAPVAAAMASFCPNLLLPAQLMAQQLLAFVPFSERLATCAAVNRTWLALVKHPALWSVAQARTWYIATQSQWKDPHRSALFRSADGMALTFEAPTPTLHELGVKNGDSIEAKISEDLF